MPPHAVVGPELSPNICLACHTHRCENGWVSLDIDLLDGHAYLCGDCADAVTHASGGATRGIYEGLQALVQQKDAQIEEIAQELAQAKLDTTQVVKVEDAFPFIRRPVGRPRKSDSPTP